MPNTPEEMGQLMKQCIEVTRYYTQRCNEVFGLSLPEFKITFNLKGRTAGRAFIGKNIIAFNPTLLRDNPEAFLARTPGHEVVHFAAYAKYGHDIKAHGNEWQRMMATMGLSTKRCHNYNMANIPSERRRQQQIAPITPKPYRSMHGTVNSFGIGKITEFD